MSSTSASYTRKPLRLTSSAGPKAYYPPPACLSDVGGEPPHRALASPNRTSMSPISTVSTISPMGRLQLMTGDGQRNAADNG